MVGRWMLDLQWKFRLARSPGVKNALVSFAAVPQLLLKSLPFWNISNSEIALSVELDPIHRPQRLWYLTGQIQTDLRGQTASSSSDRWNKDQLTAWPLCVCKGVWYQGETPEAKSRGRKSSANALGKKPEIWDQETGLDWWKPEDKQF